MKPFEKALWHYLHKVTTWVHSTIQQSHSEDKGLEETVTRMVTVAETWRSSWSSLGEQIKRVMYNPRIPLNLQKLRTKCTYNGTNRS